MDEEIIAPVAGALPPILDPAPTLVTNVLNTAPVFTPEQIKEDGRNRVSRTGGQVGVASAIVIVVTAALQGRGVLHGPLPQLVNDAWVIIATAAVSLLMNRSKLKGES